MIEKKKDFCCFQGHQQPVVKIALNPKLSMYQRLLCMECLDNTKIEINAEVVELSKIISLIEENQVKKMEKVENIIMNSIKLIEPLHSIFDQMKQNVIQQLNQFMTIIMEWIQNLQEKGSQYSQNSFYEVLENIFIKQNKTDVNQQAIINEILKTNLCWSSKLQSKLEKFDKFLEQKKFKEILSSLELDSLKVTQSKQQQQINTQVKSLEIQYLNTKINIEEPQKIQNNPINMKPFNYQIIQKSQISSSEYCLALAIDNDCSTLLAGCNSYIKNHQINLNLNEHKHSVFTLNFMKKSRQFISGGHDGSTAKDKKQFI